MRFKQGMMFKGKSSLGAVYLKFIKRVKHKWLIAYLNENKEEFNREILTRAKIFRILNKFDFYKIS